MNPVKALLPVAVIALSSAAIAAAPEVSAVSMSQGDGRMVTVSYTLSAPAVVTLDIVTNSPSGGWASIGGEHVRNVAGDVWKKVEAGSRTITWFPAMSWPGHSVAASGAKARVTAWPLDDTPDYMVVDIACGAAAKTVWFYPSAEYLPGGVLGNADYRLNKIVMRRIHAANVPWTMGALFESGRNAEYDKPHPVTLAEDYYIGIFELTQSQFLCVAGFNPSGFAAKEDSMFRPLNNLPYNNFRCNVCTNKASAAYEGGGWPNAPYKGSFLDLLRTRTGIAFDLPSEAQWEFAGRSGTAEEQWNNGVRKEAALMPGRYLGSGDEVCPVACGSYEPSKWGLYDIHGNIFEICNDWLETDITGLGGAVNVSSSDPLKTIGGATGSTRVRRGGAYHANPNNVSNRSLGADPTGVAQQWGYRLICPVGIAD